MSALESRHGFALAGELRYGHIVCGTCGGLFVFERGQSLFELFFGALYRQPQLSTRGTLDLELRSSVGDRALEIDDARVAPLGVRLDLIADAADTRLLVGFQEGDLLAR